MVTVMISCVELSTAEEPAEHSTGRIPPAPGPEDLQIPSPTLSEY